MTAVHIKTFLETFLKKEEINNVEYNIKGTSEKGDGYLGDIIFITITGTTPTGDLKRYDLVLKCSKTSAALREKTPAKQAFLNEIYLYDVVFPIFAQFQKERNVDEPFGKVAKCYGTVSTGDMEIIALENLKSKGYFLWERTTPLTRKHVEMVVKEYGKFHSISVAMREQEPEKFKGLAEKMHNVLIRFTETSKMFEGLEQSVQEVSELLVNDLDSGSLEKWLTLKSKVRPFFKSISQPVEELNVITHGDCWSNNFLHYHKDGEPFTFAILDWQLSTLSSPILDLSYFLFTTVAEKDILELNSILKHYHTCFSEHLKKCGSDYLSYSFDQLLNDWKKYCKFGILMAMAAQKFSLSENEDIPDIVQAAEEGTDILDAFLQPVKDTARYRKRMKYIVKYVVENNLI